MTRVLRQNRWTDSGRATAAQSTHSLSKSLFYFYSRTLFDGQLRETMNECSARGSSESCRSAKGVAHTNLLASHNSHLRFHTEPPQVLQLDAHTRCVAEQFSEIFLSDGLGSYRYPFEITKTRELRRIVQVQQGHCCRVKGFQFGVSFSAAPDLAPLFRGATAAGESIQCERSHRAIICKALFFMRPTVCGMSKYLFPCTHGRVLTEVLFVMMMISSRSDAL